MLVPGTKSKRSAKYKKVFRTKSKLSAKYRVRDNPNNQQPLKDSIILKDFLWSCVSGDGCFCFEFETFEKYIDDTSTYTEKQRLCARMRNHATAKYLPFIHIGVWHHLWPLCCFGSVEDDRNYHIVSICVHLKCHAALAYLFSFIPGLLHSSLRMMLNLKSMH
jgi:hypothetical protein